MPKAKKKKKIDIPTMITQSKARDFAKTIDPGIRMSGDYWIDLNDQLARIINDSIRRCNENGRKTLRPSDL